MTIPHLSESTIRQHASDQSFHRGQDYYRSGAVVSITRRGNRIQAEVEGSQYLPYQVEITFDENGLTGAYCSCPYDWGGWCKHIIAVLLTCLYEPDQIEERPSVETLLSDLSRDQLLALLLKLTEGAPDLADRIEHEISLMQTAPAEAAEAAEGAPRQRRTPVDPATFRRQVRYLLHSLDRMPPSEAYWEIAGVVDEVRQLLNRAWDFIEAGDGRNALTILEAITDEYIAGWVYLDDSNGDVSGFFDDLAPAWAEAILSADLSPQERRTWEQKLAQWQYELDEYGLDDVFEVAREAARQGWDYPPLLRVLQGEITEKGAWEDEAPWYADALAVARLNVLERQGRYQEYLYLAEAEGQTKHYLRMLVRLGRVQEAVAYGLRHTASAEEALALAKTLREHGAVEEALRIAEHGLTLEGMQKPLARWLSETAQSIGREEMALEAAIVAFREGPDLASYRRVQELAGPRWPKIKPRLLEHVERLADAEAAVEIYLHEGLVDRAVQAVDRVAYVSYDTLERVVDAAIESHPDWVIRQCQQQAERIMDAGQSRYYHHAIRWLEKARAAYLAAGRGAAWDVYLDGLLTRHRRKYKLVPMLETLRR